MSFLKRFFGVDERPLATRAIDSFTTYPGLTEQLLAVQGLTARDYDLPSIRDALSVPAVWRAVSLLSNTGAALPLEAFRNGEKMDGQDGRPFPPKLVLRPNPFSTPRAFVRNTIYSMATRGEALWWISSRDNDGYAQALIPLNPAEVLVKWAKGLEGIEMDFVWRDRPMPREDIVHLTLMRDLGRPRGMGPLQLCGAAISVALESTEWAAQFFGGGGIPSVLLKWAGELSKDESQKLKDEWTETPSNQPKVASGGLEAEPFGMDPEKATFTDIRDSSVGEIARMFGIPGHLEAYGVSGANLTYQSLPEVASELIRFTLWPEYLEPIEQAITDLLPRTTTARFDVDALLRPDAKTRMEIHEKAIASGVYDAAYAQQLEGIVPGGVDTAPVPPAPPSAFPATSSVPAKV